MLFIYISCGYSPEKSKKDILLSNDTNYSALSGSDADKVKKRGQLLGLIEFEEKERKYEREWHMIEDSIKQIQLSIPNNWEIEIDDRSLLYTKIDNKEGFFIIVAHDRNLNDLSLNQYVEYYMSAMTNDVEERLFWSNFEEGENEEGIIGIASATEGKNGKNFYHSYLFEYQNYLFEVTIKFKNENDINLYKTIVEKIIGGIYIDDINVVDNVTR